MEAQVATWQAESDETQAKLDAHLANRTKVNKFILAVTLAMRAPGPLLPPPGFGSGFGPCLGLGSRFGFG